MCVVACSTCRSAVNPLLVVIDSGPLIGHMRPGSREFLGIPFAAPPLGPLRFRAPAPVVRWSTPRDATSRGPACPQPKTNDVIRQTDEDCLNLNVWVPDGGGERLPVLVWLHGGGYYSGSGADGLYDGALLATEAKAIVVTVNYRLGPLGFLSHRALAKEANVPVSASMGILDQRAALAWVQRNIAAFGGAPEQVTLFGESAGAASVCTHLASPKSLGLFSRAIMQSGACSDAFYFDGAAAEAQGDALADAVGCTGPQTLECLRGKSANELVSALPIKRGLLLRPGIWWGPVADGIELPTLPLTALRRGAFAKVPLIIGWNRDEGMLFTHALKEVSGSELKGFLADVFGAAAAAAVPSRYPREPPKDSLAAVVTDGIFACNARRVARVVAKQNVPVFLYEFSHPLDDPRPHSFGATHTVELWFVFGNADLGVGLSDAERPLSQSVMQAWGRFARGGNPSGGAFGWPRYTLAGDQQLIIDTQPSIGSHLKQAECDLWDSFSTEPG